MMLYLFVKSNSNPFWKQEVYNIIENINLILYFSAIDRSFLPLNYFTFGQFFLETIICFETMLLCLDLFLYCTYAAQEVVDCGFQVQYLL